MIEAGAVQEDHCGQGRIEITAAGRGEGLVAID
jgi:hypothetical protein